MVSGLNEAHVCVGDQYAIGEFKVETSQPREPCERLSFNTQHSQTQHIVFI